MELKHKILTEKFIKEITGLSVNIKPNANNLYCCDVDIKPSECGPVAPLFKKISLEIWVSKFNYEKIGGHKGYYLYLQYSYYHFGGQNGHREDFITIDGCKTFSRDL